MRLPRGICWLSLALFSANAAPTWADSNDRGFSNDIQPLFKKFCIECHSGSEPEGDLRLDTVSRATHVDDHPELWDDIVAKLRRNEMPPKDSPQPSPAQVTVATNWIEQRLAKLVEADKPNPGRVTMRRLNRVEYNNTIRDLVGVDFQPADDFPVDDTGYGFDNNGDVLSMPPLLLEKYLAAAEQIINAAIVEKLPGELLQRFEGKDFRVAERGQIESSGSLRKLLSQATIEVEVNVPTSGPHEIVIRAFGDQAGSEPVRMSVRADGQEIKLVDVPANPSATGEYALPWKFESGRHKVSISFMNDLWLPSEPDPNARDRNLYIESLELRTVGDKSWEKKPETHRRIVLREPQPKGRHQLVKECLSKFATRAFRRPVKNDEVGRLVELYQLASREGATFEGALKVALQAVLVSPHFLFRIEMDPPGPGDNGTRRLNNFELASRLSYFLWSSMPDDKLLDAAKQDDLKRDGGLAKHVHRMLADGKSLALVDNFAGQWLQLRKLDLITPDPDRFSQFTPELRADMRRETELFFAAILREDRPVTEFLDSDFTYLNERLAKHYGIQGVSGDEFRRVNVARGERGGVVTQASILTLTSNPTRTSPVKRGKWVLENLLGAPPPPPPPGVPELPDAEHSPVAGSLRQRLEQHRAKSECAVCHDRIDPLGFGLENYDAIGAWRKHDGESNVDASGTLPDGSSFKGPGELKSLLVSRRDEFASVLAEKLLIYALGRGLTRADKPAVQRIVETSKKDNYKLTSMILAVVESDPFTKRALETTEVEP